MSSSGTMSAMSVTTYSSGTGDLCKKTAFCASSEKYVLSVRYHWKKLRHSWYSSQTCSVWTYVSSVMIVLICQVCPNCELVPLGPHVSANVRFGPVQGAKRT